MSLSVEISSSSLPQRVGVLDVYRPTLRSFDNNGFNTYHQQVEHLDIVATWKGLSVAHAHEILFWERATKIALESHIEELLISIFIEEVKDVDNLPALETLYRMRDFVNSLGRRQIATPLHELAGFMLQYHEVYGAHLTWLLNASDPTAAITNFLRTFDFFSQNDTGVCLFQVRFEAFVDWGDEDDLDDNQERAKKLYIFGIIQHTPHELDFINWDHTLQQPLFREPVLANEVPLFPLDINYTCNDWGLATVTVLKHFPENIRLERVYRVKIVHDKPAVVSPPPKPLKSSPPTAVKTCTSSRRKAKQPFRPESPRNHPSSVPKAKTMRARPPNRATLRVPINPLRAVSTGSSRVQGRGRSDFERAAMDNHDGVARSYQDVSVHKAFVAPKLKLEDMRPENVEIRMMGSAPSGLPMRSVRSFWDNDSPPPVEAIEASSARRQFRGTKTEEQFTPISPLRSTPRTKNYNVQQDEMPPLDQEMSIQKARKLKHWADENLRRIVQQERNLKVEEPASRSDKVNKSPIANPNYWQPPQPANVNLPNRPRAYTQDSYTRNPNFPISFPQPNPQDDVFRDNVFSEGRLLGREQHIQMLQAVHRHSYDDTSDSGLPDSRQSDLATLASWHDDILHSSDLSEDHISNLFPQYCPTTTESYQASSYHSSENQSSSSQANHYRTREDQVLASEAQTLLGDYTTESSIDQSSIIENPFIDNASITASPDSPTLRSHRNKSPTPPLDHPSSGRTISAVPKAFPTSRYNGQRTRLPDFPAVPTHQTPTQATQQIPTHQFSTFPISSHQIPPQDSSVQIYSAHIQHRTPSAEKPPPHIQHRTPSGEKFPLSGKKTSSSYLTSRRYDKQTVSTGRGKGKRPIIGKRPIHSQRLLSEISDIQNMRTVDLALGEGETIQHGGGASYQMDLRYNQGGMATDTNVPVATQAVGQAERGRLAAQETQASQVNDQQSRRTRSPFGIVHDVRRRDDASRDSASPGPVVMPELPDAPENHWSPASPEFYVPYNDGGDWDGLEDFLLFGTAERGLRTAHEAPGNTETPTMSSPRPMDRQNAGSQNVGQAETQRTSRQWSRPDFQVSAHEHEQRNRANAEAKSSRLAAAARFRLESTASSSTSALVHAGYNPRKYELHLSDLVPNGSWLGSNEQAGPIDHSKSAGLVQPSTESPSKQEIPLPDQAEIKQNWDSAVQAKEIGYVQSAQDREETAVFEDIFASRRLSDESSGTQDTNTSDSNSIESVEWDDDDLPVCVDFPTLGYPMDIDTEAPATAAATGPFYAPFSFSLPIRGIKRPMEPDAYNDEGPSAHPPPRNSPYASRPSYAPRERPIGGISPRSTMSVDGSHSGGSDSASAPSQQAPSPFARGHPMRDSWEPVNDNRTSVEPLYQQLNRAQSSRTPFAPGPSNLSDEEAPIPPAHLIGLGPLNGSTINPHPKVPPTDANTWWASRKQNQAKANASLKAQAEQASTNDRRNTDEPLAFELAPSSHDPKPTNQETIQQRTQNCVEVPSVQAKEKEGENATKEKKWWEDREEFVRRAPHLKYHFFPGGSCDK
ncbi:hypothetical protein BT63DRAFT_123158 [Microthyrium microscopicum]|uniref:Uncharacterized protein n=1 Tax=Microthyrium microscopicum TaxID=703497 RepID=A0A6A6TX65_9PEZI|nr:hypothetical protein BT63DRAFT_123158 [Microthyrium microscopicum]